MPTNIVVPNVGESIVDARIAKWLKHAGDAVTAGEPLVELETDKIDVEVPAPATGVLATIAHNDGDDVKVGEVIGTVEAKAADAKADGDVAKPASASASKPEPKADAATAKPEPGPAAKPAAPAPAPSPAPAQNAAPVGRKAEPAKPKPEPVETSQPASAAPSADAPVERVRMSKRRATIARRLVEAQRTAAMLTTFNEVDMSAVMALRERHGKSFEERHKVRLGMTSFFVRAAVAALREFPRLNAEVQGDEMVLKHFYNIGVAVGAAGGLVVPVLHKADRMTFAGIEAGIRAAKKKADDGTLTLDDLSGGTFTITNGGVFGSLMSTPILNAPEVGILGLHAIQQRPVGVDGQVVLRPMMYLALSYDHRIVDGSEAVQFLVRIQKLVADPVALLIEQ